MNSCQTCKKVIPRGQTLCNEHLPQVQQGPQIRPKHVPFYHTFSTADAFPYRYDSGNNRFELTEQPLDASFNRHLQNIPRRQVPIMPNLSTMIRDTVFEETLPSIEWCFEDIAIED